ncbi:MAG: hypothetical protein ACPF9D_12760 [Owenweeksia sp.]
MRLFGKPTTRPYRRMGVVLVYDEKEKNTEELRQKARQIADRVTVN